MKNVLGGIAGGVFVGIGVPIIFGLVRVPDFDLGWTETFAAVLGHRSSLVMRQWPRTRRGTAVDRELLERLRTELAAAAA